MPNWCTQNIACTGKKEELEALAALINSLPKRKNSADNDFGKFWIYNLYALLGVPFREDAEFNGRGVIDPNFYARPCLFIQDPMDTLDDCEDFPLKVYSTTTEPQMDLLYFSIHSAWGPCCDFWKVVNKKFPSIHPIASKATDDSGNFHIIDDPKGLLDQETFICECDSDDGYIETNDEAQFCKDVLKVMGYPPDKVSTYDELYKLYLEWIEDDDNESIIFDLYKWETKSINQ